MSNDPKPRLAIIYGWAEGPWHARRLINSARPHFEIVTSPLDADIILAHSAGCFLVPHEAKAKLIVLVGPPLWPGKLLWVSTAQKITSDFKVHHQEGEIRFWILKTFHNLLYACVYFPHAFKMLTARHKASFYDGAGQVIAVRNNNDPFCDPKMLKKLSEDKNWRYLEFDGIHDECWYKPDKYLAIMKDSYERVLA